MGTERSTIALTMEDFIEGWESLQKTNTGRCWSDGIKHEFPYKDNLLTFFLNKGTQEISFQQVLNEKLKEINEGNHGMCWTREDAIRLLAVKAAAAAINYISFQSDVPIGLTRRE